MTKLTDLPEITAIADTDLLYLWRPSDPSTPDKKIQRLNMRPSGARITNYQRFQGTIIVPALAAGIEADAAVSVPGVLAGDHVTFGLTTSMPANIGILHSWVSAADVVSVRFRNLHASTAYAGATLPCTAMATRTIA